MVTFSSRWRGFSTPVSASPSLPRMLAIVRSSAGNTSSVPLPSALSLYTVTPLRGSITSRLTRTAPPTCATVGRITARAPSRSAISVASWRSTGCPWRCMRSSARSICSCEITLTCRDCSRPMSSAVSSASSNSGSAVRFCRSATTTQSRSANAIAGGERSIVAIPPTSSVPSTSSSSATTGGRRHSGSSRHALFPESGARSGDRPGSPTSCTSIGAGTPLNR